MHQVALGASDTISNLSALGYLVALHLSIHLSRALRAIHVPVYPLVYRLVWSSTHLSI